MQEQVLDPRLHAPSASKESKGGRPYGQDASASTAEFWPALGDLPEGAPLEQRLQSFVKEIEMLGLNLTVENIMQTTRELVGLRDQGKFEGLRILCDGMGGEAMGHVASNLAIAIARREVLAAFKKGNKPGVGIVKTALIKANEAVSRYSEKIGKISGTTFIMALTEVDGKTHGVSVGDSRTYLKTADGEVTQVDLDNSLVFSLAASQQLNPSEIFTHPQRNQILKSLGSGPISLTDNNFFEINMRSGDQLMMVSDGVWEGILHEWIAQPWGQEVLRKADEMYRANPTLENLRKANGFLFKELSLRGLSAQATPAETAEYLNRRAVGMASDDNTSVTVFRFQGEAAKEEVKEPPEMVYWTHMTDPAHKPGYYGYQVKERLPDGRMILVDNVGKEYTVVAKVARQIDTLNMNKQETKALADQLTLAKNLKDVRAIIEAWPKPGFWTQHEGRRRGVIGKADILGVLSRIEAMNNGRSGYERDLQYFSPELRKRIEELHHSTPLNLESIISAIFGELQKLADKVRANLN